MPRRNPYSHSPGAAASGGRKAKERRAAGLVPTGMRPACGEVHPGGDYSALETEFLRRVDKLRQRVRFPAATDYFRLAQEVLGGMPAGD